MRQELETYPAILSLYFIFQFEVTTVFKDEWIVVPNLGLFFYLISILFSRFLSNLAKLNYF